MTEPRGSVLIVEDDDSLRTIVVRYLRGQRFTVAEAASSEEAVAAMDDGLHPDVVLLDINLPGDTGWDLLRGPTLSGEGSPAVQVGCLSLFQWKRWSPRSTD